MVKKSLDSYEDVSQVYEEGIPDFDAGVNIALVGKVSAGKSSLINAILQRGRENPLAKVGATSGVTKKVTAYRLDDNVLICDCPGLHDVRQENSEETRNFLKSIDLGIFVVTGSADATQKEIFEDLRKHSSHVLVVLNKIDEWDDLEDEALIRVMDEWKKVLGVDKVFGACTKGYDPLARASAPMDIRGVDEVREELYRFLGENRKDIILARQMADKSGYAVKIIGAAMAAVAGQSFLPGSAVYITATQAISITSLNYLYRGEVMSKSSALALLPNFVGQSVGRNAFIWLKSVLPPTGVVDAAAAAVAVGITFSMLAAVKYLLENEKSLSEKEELVKAYRIFEKVWPFLKQSASIKDFSKLGWVNLVEKFFHKAA